jgi:hypothetical protein
VDSTLTVVFIVRGPTEVAWPIRGSTLAVEDIRREEQASSSVRTKRTIILTGNRRVIFISVGG